MPTLVRLVGNRLAEAVVAAAVAVIVASVGLLAFSTVHWPAFNSSNVTRSVMTVGQVGAAVALGIAIALRRAHKLTWLAKLLSWVGLSGFVTVTLGMPLAATKLYLFGISVDQEFRTAYLTRLTDSAALRDMTYADLPPYYPAGWFWVGGRVAHLLGLPGWEAFKPYAIGSLAVAAVVAVVLWSQLIRADWAIAVTAATTAVAVAYAAPEAYGAVLVLLLPPAMVLAWGALHRPALWEATNPGGGRGWAAAVGTGLFLGVSAMFYSLYFVVAVFAVVLMAVLAWLVPLWNQRSRQEQPIGISGAARLRWILARLVVAGIVAGVLALLVWAPYLLAAVRHQRGPANAAFHYLPDAGARVMLPMTEFSLLGVLCLIGTIWLVLRAGSSRRAQGLGIAVAAIYLWTLASLAVTAGGTTLLSFRLEPILRVLLAAAGVFGFLEAVQAAQRALGHPRRIAAAAVVLAVAGALGFAQNIPTILTAEITTAYTDTDGNGQRADRRSPSAVSYYRDVDAALIAQTGRSRDRTVVLTADTSFLAYYPYFGFQALTAHYANPLADFPARAREINRWSRLHSAPEFVDALHHSRWRPPDAFLFRRSDEGYTLRLAEDVYPNDPNVRRYTVTFPTALFADSHFRVTDIGPFTLVVAHY